MGDLRILVIEDEPTWQDELSQTLRRLGENVHVDPATTYNDALKYSTSTTYDLAVVDLALPDVPSEGAEKAAMPLLQKLRNSHLNRHCGLIVLTGYPSTERLRLAFRDYDVYDFIDKHDFDNQHFVEVARAAILSARLLKAKAQDEARYRLTVRFNQEYLVGSELSGPNEHSVYTAQDPVRFGVADLSERADRLDFLVREGGPERWRPEARSIGDRIREIVSEEKRIQGDLRTAKALSDRSSNMWLQFSGPSTGLGVPFELLRDQDETDYLALTHILTRRLDVSLLERKVKPFHTFLNDLRTNENGEPLQILIVGANSDGKIPAAEDEATTLAGDIQRELRQLGIVHNLTTLLGPDATYANVSTALRDGRYHIFHYAGHGRYSGALPEVSGLMLHDDTLTASDLSPLVRDTELRMVFLSCCLSARSAGHTGRGDFHGLMDALVRAGVPIVLGYRWSVADTPALNLAQTFYQALWRTFSPGEALLEARLNATKGRHKRDDDTWAAPVLLMQNV